MISVIHGPLGPVTEEEDYPLSARARRVRLDWDLVADAFQVASDQLGWDADFCVYPMQRHVWIIVPAALMDRVATTTLDFYAAVADRIGMKEFLSVWVDFDVVD